MGTTERIGVLIADDHPIVREGLRDLISTEAGMQVVAEATDGTEAARLARLLRPDVILLDLKMPGLDGITAIREIVGVNPEARILVLTSFSEDDRVAAAIKAGAAGYLLKDSSPRDLLQAIRQVASGEVALSPSIASQVARNLNQPPDQPPARPLLTKRELEVLRLVGRGLPNQQIAASMVISERTARSYVSSILKKLQLGSRTQAAYYAVRSGLVRPE